VFLLSDGAPTDDFDAGLAELQKNNWFKAAIKVAVAIGDDARKDELAKFTGAMESVLEVHNAAMLRKMIRFVSVRASQVASKSLQVSPVQVSGFAQQNLMNTAITPDTGLKQQALNEQLQEIIVEASADSGDDEW
jgi:uncharacterized protein YegL